MSSAEKCRQKHRDNQPLSYYVNNGEVKEPKKVEGDKQIELAKSAAKKRKEKRRRKNLKLRRNRGDDK